MDDALKQFHSQTSVAGPTAPDTAEAEGHSHDLASDDKNTCALMDERVTPPHAANGPTEIWGYPVHPYAALFPMMPEPELDVLTQSIKRNGQAEPILRWRGVILDGRNRMEACRRAGVEPRIIEDNSLDDRTALALVVSRNIHRRHLTASQRATIAAEIETMTHGGKRHRGQAATVQLESSPRITREEVSRALGVSPRLIAEAKVVKEGAPELADKVRAGQLSVTSAGRRVRRAQREPGVSPQTTRRKVNSDSPSMLPSELLGRISTDMDMFSKSDRATPAENLRAGTLAVALLRRIAPKLTAEMAEKLKADALAHLNRHAANTSNASTAEPESERPTDTVQGDAN